MVSEGRNEVSDCEVLMFLLWMFVPDHRTSIWKGCLPKGFCFEGGHIKNAIVESLDETEPSR